MQLTLSIVTLLLFELNLIAQTDSINYLGQEPPGYYPEKFAPGFFNSNEWGPVFSPDGNELFYTWQNPNGNQDYHINYRKKTNGVWSEPVPASFTDKNGKPDIEPNFTPDGKKLYFDSERAGGFGGADIWYVTKTDSGWSDPVNAGTGINTSDNDNFPSFAPDGSMYFCSDRNKSDWDIDIYYAKFDSGNFQTPIRLSDSINTSGWDACPTVINDKLFFQSTRSGGFGKGDICFSQITDGNYGEVELMSANFNTNKSEMGIVLSPDKKYLFFKHYGEDDIYWVDVEVLNYLGVKEAPFNYVASWYAGIGAQMELALHPNLVKRRVTSETTDSPASYNSMISWTNSCMGCIDNIKEGRLDITILDETESIATAKLLSNDFFDYLQLVKFDNYWKVINVVWDYYDSNIGDSAKLVTVIENYLDYWKTADTEQMEGLIHPKYSGGLALSHSEALRVNKTQLLSLISECADCNSDKVFEYEILAIYLNTASVKINISNSIEYLHLTYQNDNWYIINALRNFNFDPADIPISITKEKDESINIFPNPTNGEVYVNFSGIENPQSVSVIDMDGKIIIISNDVDMKEMSFDMSHFASGIYIIKIQHSKGIIYGKVMLR